MPSPRRSPLGRAMDPEAPGTFLRAPAWVVWSVPGLALLLLAIVELGHLNEPLFRSFNALSLYTGPGLWAHVTILGDGLVCAVLLLPWVRRHPERIWAGLLGALLMVVVLRTLKSGLALPRPLAVLPEGSVNVIGPGHRRSSFPSGHTATASLYAGIWALTLRRRWRSLLLVVPALLVGISRMAVGVHWPADVMAGLALGWLSAAVGLRWAEKMPWGTKRTGRLALGVALVVSALVMLFIDHTGYPGVLGFQRALAALCLAWGAWGLWQVWRVQPPPGATP